MLEMRYMARTVKKSQASTRLVESKKAPGRVRKRSTNRTKASAKISTRKTTSKTHHQPSDTTYIFECTRPGCGYRIPREEKAETGSLRSDLKCPKCHHREFKCLGKGDLPASFELPVPTTNIDFDSIRPVDLGSN